MDKDGVIVLLSERLSSQAACGGGFGFQGEALIIWIPVVAFFVVLSF